MKTKNFIGTFALCIALLTAVGQNITKQVDALIAKNYPTDGPGGAILIAKGGKAIYTKGFGKASLELNVNNTANHVFEIGSITKQFTAVAILMLEEEGKLTVNDPITMFLPDYPTHGETITIHHLLTHTSGITGYTDLQEWAQKWRLDMPLDSIIALFKDLPLEFKPGEKWSYSNSGYILLGAIIEKASGMSYEEFVETRIFKTLGMANSVYGSRSEIITNRAAGYMQADEKTFINAEFLSMTQPYAAGSIMSTVGDLLIWQNALRDNKIITQASKEKAWKNYPLNNGKPMNYGYGWMPNEIFGSPSVEHSGGIFGYTSNGLYMPNEDVYVIILTNCSCKNAAELSTEIAALAIGKPLVNPATLPLTDQQLQEYVAIYEFDDGTTRTITRDGNQLYSMRTGGAKYEIYPFKPDEFYLKDSFTRLRFVRNNMNEIGEVETAARIDKQVAKRTNRVIVEKVAIELPTPQLQRLEGVFELAPGFNITIDERASKLYLQATGQPEFELFALSPLRFFLTVVDAEIEFIEGADGKIESLILFQNGQEMPGKKIK